jgi:hypothetical protein
MKKLSLLAVVLALATATLHSTVMLPMFMDDLAGSSQTVVLGTITGKRTEWGPDRRMIFTVYSVAPQQYLKGSLGNSFELREPGGELDGEGFYVASVPQYQVGQEAVLFVWTDRAGQHQVTAFDQGSVPVVVDAGGARQAARQIPLGSARTAQSSNSLVDSAREATRLAPTVALSEKSLSGLLSQIRASVARTQPAAE